MPRTAADHGLPYFPAFLDLARKRVLVVGGGHVATTKVRALLPCQAQVTVVAPEVSSSSRSADVHVEQRAFVAGDVDGMDLVFAASDDRR
jgi:siroheme synthase-like protein